MIERLQKFLSRAGIASRRHAEGLISAGRVSVNNERVTELGSKVDPDKDLVTVDGKVVTLPEEKAYYLVYKPSGMVTTLEDPQGRPTVKDLLSEVGRRVFPVGRLDWDAEGALLFTDDGDLANKLMHPSYQVPRTYLAKVKGVPDAATLEKLRGGVRLEDGMATPLSVDVFEATEKNTWLKLVVSEGRPHLVKRLCAAIGHPVVRLFRPAQGGISVDGLRPGELRPLTSSEVERVHQVAEGKAFPEMAFKLPPRRHGRSSDASEEEGAEPFEVPGREARPAARAPRGQGGQRPAFARGRTGEGRGARGGFGAEEGARGEAPAGRERRGGWEQRGEGRMAERVWSPRGAEGERSERGPGGRFGAAGGARGAGRGFGGPRGERGERSEGGSGGRFGAAGGARGPGRGFGGARGERSEGGAGRFGAKGGAGGAGRGFGGPRGERSEGGPGGRFGAAGGARGAGRGFGGPRGERSEGGPGGRFGGARGAGRGFGGPRGERGEGGGGGRFGAEGGARGAGRSFGGPRGERSEAPRGGGRFGAGRDPGFGGKPRSGGKFGKPATRPSGGRKGGPGRGPGRGR